MARHRVVVLLSGPGRGRALAAIMLLMVASALTEAFGLLLFVPMLAAIGGGGMLAGRVGTVLAALGVPHGLGPLLLLFIALAAARSVINHLRDMAIQRFEFGVVDGLRARAWDALLHCEWSTLSQMRQSDGASLLISEVERVGRGLDQLFAALGTLLTLAGLALAALVIAPEVAFSAIVGGGLMLLVYGRIRRRANLHGERLGAAYRAVHAEFNEGLGALRVIKSFGCEERAAAAGAAAVFRMRRTETEFMRGLGHGQIALQSGGALVLAALVWVAVTRWGAGSALILPLVALSLRALPLLAGLHHTLQNWDYASPALDRSLAMIATAEAAREPEPGDDAQAPVVEREIALHGVSVQFAGRSRPALDRIDLVLPARTITALVGASGAGKSTLADVLGGLVMPDQGSLAIDGIELAGGMRRSWRRQVTYVQQDAWLSAGSVRDNLAWADPTADQARMHDALRLASAQFVEALPDGLDTVVGDGGQALSEGERQRIVLARALLRQPQLLILDEATGALDRANEAAIAEAVAGLRQRMTILVIGHRGLLTDIADRTVSIADGRIVSDIEPPSLHPGVD